MLVSNLSFYCPYHLIDILRKSEINNSAATDTAKRNVDTPPRPVESWDWKVFRAIFSILPDFGK